MYIHIPSLRQTCPQCGTIASPGVDICTKCNHQLMSPESIRTRGWVLLLLGAPLTAGMVYLIVLIAGIMQNSGNPDATIRFDGDGLDGMMVFGVLGLVLVIAMTIVVAGIWQIKYRRRNPKIVRAMLWLVGSFIVIGAVLRLIG